MGDYRITTHPRFTVLLLLFLGKTFTILGDADHPGIIPRSVNGVLDRIHNQSHEMEMELSFSYLEIYNEKVLQANFHITDFEGTLKNCYRVSIR